MSRRLFSVILALLLSGCSAASEDTGAPEPAWVELFDGGTLDRWIVKIAGAETGSLRSALGGSGVATGPGSTTS